MEDIKQELRQDNLQVKSNAIAKLTYVCIFLNLKRSMFITYLILAANAWL